MPLKLSREITLSLLCWILVWAFWLFVTRGSHPTFLLALITTTSLVAAYATVVYVNHLSLLPRFRRTGNLTGYAVSLLVAMLSLTAMALAIIRISYFQLVGPDLDPNGAYKHFTIDLFGMAVHLLLAAGFITMAKRFGTTTPSRDD